MTPELKTLLLELRQHALFPELLRAVEKPVLKPYKPSSGDDLASAGARLAYYSGRKDGDQTWRTFLTGVEEREE